jgi:hypothetical protein
VSNENSLVVLEETYIRYKTKTEKALKVQCTKCMQDSELHGDATYIVNAGNFKKGQKPCGCSKSQKRTKEQWEITIKRRAEITMSFWDLLVGIVILDKRRNLGCTATIARMIGIQPV